MVKKIDRQALGDQIRRVRVLRGFTQEQLAEMMNRSGTHLSHIETGKSNISLESLVTLSNALKIDIGVLLSDSLESHRYDSYTEQFHLLLKDCNDFERHLLYEIARSSREVLRNTDFRKDMDTFRHTDVRKAAEERKPYLANQGQLMDKKSLQKENGSES